MTSESEFRAYPYIIQVLQELGWDTKNPRRGGSVYTQGEFRKHDTILDDARGLSAPENIVLIPWDGGYRYWIVEAKAGHKDLDKAAHEAKQYAESINRTGGGLARFITGIAGTPDETFYVTTQFWNGKQWDEVAINNYETTGFLSQEQCKDILGKNSPKLTLFDDSPERFLAKANAINKTLHANEIPVGDRAKIMAALLLALAQDGNLRIHAKPRALMREINGLIEDLLKQHGKGEFAEVIKLALPATEKNHRKFRKAIIDTLQHLREMNIRSAINGSDDALGKFYETFLKYANGAKEMGIVLTPRHITKFAADVVGVGPKDHVFDPACGTGGFLISAMESMRRKSPPNDYAKFRMDSLYGVEQRDDVYGLAIVNMIFRGDGKSCVYDGDCFDHEFWQRDGEVWYSLDKKVPEGAVKPFSRVFMNPPFKLTSNDETSFVDYGLSQIREGGIMFVVLPFVVVGGKTNEAWRRRLLERHTLLACLKLDKNLFYPVAEATYAIILKAHEPHPNGNTVFMGSLFDDNHRPRRSKMLSDFDALDNVERMTDSLRRFLLGQPVVESIDRQQRLVNLYLVENDSDFSPEGYLPSGSTSINASFRAIGSESARRRVKAKATGGHANRAHRPLTFPLSEFIERVETTRLKTIKEYPKGNVPVVSATSSNNGIADWLEIPDELCFENCITVSLLHNTKPCQAFWHPYRFAALVGKALVLRPKKELLRDPNAIFYLCESITANNAWRYHYARSVKLHELMVDVPTRYGKPNIEAMAGIVREQLSGSN